MEKNIAGSKICVPKWECFALNIEKCSKVLDKLVRVQSTSFNRAPVNRAGRLNGQVSHGPDLHYINSSVNRAGTSVNRAVLAIFGQKDGKKLDFLA